jgi:hypothetical protein
MLKGLVIVPSNEILSNKKDKNEKKQKENEQNKPKERESWMTTPLEEKIEEIPKETPKPIVAGPTLETLKPKSEVSTKNSTIDVAWREKSLNRARERAKEEGISVDEILFKTWGKTESEMMEIIQQQKYPNQKKNFTQQSTSISLKNMKKPEDSSDLKWKKEPIGPVASLNTPQVSSIPQIQPSKMNLLDMEADLNKLSGKALKAQLMGDMETYNELNSKIEQIRNLLQQGDHDDVVVLPEFDSRGNKITKKLTDSANLDDLVLEMKQNGSHEDVMYQSYDKLDTDDQYDSIGNESMNSKKRKRDDEENKLRKKQINEYNKMKSIGDTCTLCYNSPKMKKYLIIALGEKAYLAIPPFGSLLKNHCIISTFEHRNAMNQCDEDEWNEIIKFRSSLKKMFASLGKDVLFIETVTSYNMKKQLHSFIECIPISYEDMEVAPGYFKKAILDSDSEWSQNQKLIDTRGKGISRSIPKDFPYFHVEFSLNGGYAHIIEDWTKFPYYFGREIVAGIMDLPLNLIKEREETEEKEKSQVLEFLQIFEKFDWTIELDGGEY